MKVHKIDDIRFSVKPDGQVDFSEEPLGRRGELHISDKGIVIKENDDFFEIPIECLYDIKIIESDTMRLRFECEGMILDLEGNQATRLWALRTLLLPLLEGKGEPTGMKIFLTLWCAGLHNMDMIGDIMSKEKVEIEKMLERATERNYISDKNDLTNAGLDLFSSVEKNYLEDLEGNQ